LCLILIWSFWLIHSVLWFSVLGLFGVSGVDAFVGF
jgi:hypothetical protein